MSEAALLSRIFALLRGAVLGLLGVVLSKYQGHAEYSGWMIFSIIFVVTTFNRFNWIAAVIIVWLLMLYFATPQMVAWLGRLA